MCNLYDINGSAREIASRYSAICQMEFHWPTLIAPRLNSPTIMAGENGCRELVPMRFGLTPVGSRSPEDKRPLNNARIESYDKWPWNIPFRCQRCVIPVSRFREPLYWGEHAGKEAFFFRPDKQYLLVAGLYNIWKSHDGSHAIGTMTFLMRPASAFVMEHGHHRQPFFINEDGIDAWIESGSRPSIQSLAVLNQFAANVELELEVDRSMKDGWQKRQPANVKKRDEQLAAIKSAGVLGFTVS